jgi:very-short-patch-repair endonuclease
MPLPASLSKNASAVSRAKERARGLRKNHSLAEKAFWRAVRDRRFLKLKFLRQRPIYFGSDQNEHFFIADFYCAERKLVIEIDGETHDGRQDYDEARTKILNKLGINVLRFTNVEVLGDLSGVLERIRISITQL